jgi:hypothetical protein
MEKTSTDSVATDDVIGFTDVLSDDVHRLLLEFLERVG